MAENPGDFGPARRILAQSFGEPGKRTFRLWVGVPGRSAALWLEKEQLIALASAIEELLESTPETEEPPEDATGVPGEDDAVDTEIKVGNLALGYDQAARLLRVFAGPIGALRSEPPAFACFVSREQIRSVWVEISKILARGRPICPLCHEPRDPEGHACVRQNGHLKREIPPLNPPEDED